jgi:hypothetical protein
MTIDKLIEAVEAGEWDHDAAAKWLWMKPGQHYGWAHDAFRGSLDAAKALHDALLPGWEWNIDAGDGAYVENRGDFGAPYTADIPGMPARAWLLAILKAKQAEERG